MPRRLVLFRHAKAESGGVSDHTRALTDRGRDDAAAAGLALESAGVRGGTALVSTAVRARQSAEIAFAELSQPPEMVLEDGVYANDPAIILGLINRVDPDVDPLVVVGHNPSITDLAQVLDDGTGDVAARTAMENKFPTSGLAYMEVDGAWADLQLGGGRLDRFEVPRG